MVDLFITAFGFASGIVIFDRLFRFVPNWPVLHWGGRDTEHPGWWLCRDCEDGRREWRKLGENRRG